MKTYILPAVRITATLVILFTGVYTLMVWAAAQLLPNQGMGKSIQHKNKTFYEDIGQSFTYDAYFYSRPSAVNYNAAGSGGSNKGPSDAQYLAIVTARIDTFLVHNPGIQKSEIPVDLITASGSGLDPNISVEAAKVQVKRIARIRHLQENELLKLIQENTEEPVLGLLGPKKINVLTLNIALDKL